jgi:hypothetical protein
MHANKKIIICKFNLKNKCKLGHQNVNELNDILTKFEGLKQEYESLKRNLRENFEKLSNLDKNVGDVTNNGVNALSKPLYIIVFSKKINISAKIQINHLKRLEITKITNDDNDESMDQMLTNNKSNVKRNGLNIEKIHYENEYDNKLKALEEQIKSNKQDLLYKINDLNEQMKINKNIKKEMRSKHKIAKATGLKLEIVFEMMFENEKSVLDRINITGKNLF